MLNGNLTCVLRHLHALCDLEAGKDLSDAQLLERFRARREEVAFALLVQRHGPMVLAASRRVLHEEHDAEDVFQATFLVLARKAGSIRKQGSLASWLYGVAHRIARKTAATTARRRATKKRNGDMPSPPLLDAITGQELRSVLDEEINQLPEKYRGPLVLCYFEGKTQEQAARELGCPKSSLGSRLGRARHLLQARLTQRGISLSAGALATMLTAEVAAAGVPALLTINTVRAAVLSAGKTLAAGVVSAKVSAMAEGALHAMFITKLKVGVILLVATGFLILGAGLLAQQATGESIAKKGEDANERTFAERKATIQQDAPAGTLRTDRFGDALPGGAVLRLGTLRLRHKEGIASVVFVPDSGLVITGGGDETVRLWDRDTGREMRRLEGQEGTAVALAVSRDGKLVAAATVKMIHLWDLATGKLLEKIPADTTTPIENGTSFLSKVPLALSADGKLLAFVTSAPSVRLWDVAARKERFHLKGHARPAEVLGFSADGKTLISANGDRTADGDVRLWDTSTGAERGNLRIPLKSGRSPAPFAVSPDGRTLAVEGLETVRRKVPGGIQVGTEYKVRLWDLETAQERLALPGQPNVVWSVAFSADGKHVAAALMEGRLIIWDSATGKEVQQCAGHPEGTRPDGGHTLAFSQDGKVLAAVGSSAALGLWDVASGREVSAATDAHSSAVSAVAFSPDGGIIATAGRDHMIRLWHRADGRHRLSLSDHKGSVQAMVFSPDGRRLASSSSDGVIRLWDAIGGKEVWTIQAVERSAGFYSGICPIAFSADGTGLVSWGDDSRRRIWDVPTGKERPAQPVALKTKDLTTGRPSELPDHTARVLAVAFTPDGTRAALAFHQGIHILDVATGQELCRIAGPPNVVLRMAFSPDGKYLLTGGWDKTLRLWETLTGEEVLKLAALDSVNSVAFAPDGRSVAAGVGWREGKILVFDVVAGKLSQQLKGHDTYVAALAFAPDGRCLASGQRDTTALVWEVAAAVNRPRAANSTGKNLAELWNDLGAADAGQAHTAVWTLADGGDAVTRFLQERLAPVTHTDPKRIQELIADLDNQQFTIRDSANKALAHLGIEAHPALTEAMKKGNLSLETRRRVETLLGAPPPRSVPTGDLLRRLRAIQVLSHLESPAAAKLLKTLAQGAPGARETQEAKLATQRKPR